MSSEFPRSYTPAELEAIAQSVFPFDLAFSHIERLQRAVEEYQWATQEHNREFLALHPSGLTGVDESYSNELSSFVTYKLRAKKSRQN